MKVFTMIILCKHKHGYPQTKKVSICAKSKLRNCEDRNKFTTQTVPLKYGDNANYGICINLFGLKLLLILPFSKIHGCILATDLVLSLHKSPIVIFVGRRKLSWMASMQSANTIKYHCDTKISILLYNMFECL